MLSSIFNLASGLVKILAFFFLIGVSTTIYFIDKFGVSDKDQESKESTLEVQILELNREVAELIKTSSMLKQTEEHSKNRLQQIEQQNKTYVQTLQKRESDILQQAATIEKLRKKNTSLASKMSIDKEELTQLINEKETLLANKKILQAEKNSIIDKNIVLEEKIEELNNNHKETLATNEKLILVNHLFKEREGQVNQAKSRAETIVRFQLLIYLICIFLGCTLMHFWKNNNVDLRNWITGKVLKKHKNTPRTLTPFKGQLKKQPA